MAQPRSAAATKRSRDAENRSDREALEDAMKSAVHCAQRVMALLENNELKVDDEEQSLDSLGIIQKEMGFLMRCIAVRPRVLENYDAARNSCWLK